MSFSAPSIAIGIQRAAAEEQRMVLVDEALRPARGCVPSSASVLSISPGMLDQARHQAALALGIGAVGLGQRDHQQRQRRDLRGERLGRGHADLRAGARQHHQVRFAHQRALGRRCRWRACERYPACFASRSAASVSAVSPDCEIVTNSAFFGTTGVAIAVLARDLDAARQAADLLDEVLRHEARVVAGAAGDDAHALDLREHACGGRGRTPPRAAGRRPRAPAACRPRRAAARGFP